MKSRLDSHIQPSQFTKKRDAHVTLQFIVGTDHLGQGVRNILTDHGGAEALRERYEHVSAYHHPNYRPLMRGFYSPYRAELFRLSHVLTFRSATHGRVPDYCG